MMAVPYSFLPMPQLKRPASSSSLTNAEITKSKTMKRKALCEDCRVHDQYLTAINHEG